MKNYNQEDILVTGVGITSSIGQGKAAFTDALLSGSHAFGIMSRPGRQKDSAFLGAEIDSLAIPELFPKRFLRSISFSGQVALTTLYEAWQEAKLEEVDPKRIGLIIGGSNIQQREQVLIHDDYKDKHQFLSPTYAMSFMDTDLCGVCTEKFDIKGFAYSIGGASASGQLAVIQAAEAVRSGQVDVCIAIGGLMDLSYWECQGFRSIGAMGSDRFATRPDLACRPFDRDRNGFIYGESCGAVVMEKERSAKMRSINPYAHLQGWGICMDGNRNPNPSMEGEINAIGTALKIAGKSAVDIDYVNPHGTGSGIGDEIELQTLRACGLDHTYINTTKSILGHGLSAAGAVEIIATVLQMKAGKLHPSRNMDNPMDDSFNWVHDNYTSHKIRNAISLSLGFGGINTAVCLGS